MHRATPHDTAALEFHHPTHGGEVTPAGRVPREHGREDRADPAARPDGRLQHPLRQLRHLRRQQRRLGAAGAGQASAMTMRLAPKLEDFVTVIFHSSASIRNASAL